MEENRPMPNDQIAETFEKYFSIGVARTPEEKNKTYSIRYNVYCLEFGWEDKERFSGKMESDEFDDRSVHCLITHKPSGLGAGCIRMVTEGNGVSGESFPFERCCMDSIDAALMEGVEQTRERMCEISRLAVDGRFRRRNGEGDSRYGRIEKLDFSPEELRVLPLIAVSAYLGATSICEITGRQEVFAMMEPFLPRLLRQSKIFFTRAGRDMDYHGTRALFHIRSDSVAANMRPELRPLYDLVNRRIRESWGD